MENQINRIHEQLKKLHDQQGIETLVSLKLPTGEQYNIIVARTSTLKEIKKSINEKI